MWIHSQHSIQTSKGHWWKPPFYFSGFVHWFSKVCTCRQSCYRNNPSSTSDNKHKLHPESKISGSEFSCWFCLPRGWCSVRSRDCTDPECKLLAGMTWLLFSFSLRKWKYKSWWKYKTWSSSVNLQNLVMLWCYCGACEGTITWNIALSSRTCLMPVHVTVKTWYFHAQPNFTNETQLLLNSVPWDIHMYWVVPLKFHAQLLLWTSIETEKLLNNSSKLSTFCSQNLWSWS